MSNTFSEAFKIKGVNIPLNVLSPLGDGTNVSKNENFIFDKNVLKQILFSIKEKENLLLWGDAGAGKTDLIEQVACRLNRQATIISLGEETSMRQLIGGFTLSSGETPWKDGALLMAIRQPYTIVGLDEINMAPPGVVAMLNHLLQKRELVLPETGEVIKVAKEVAFIATSNTNMGVDESDLFEGSYNQNAATRSRFAGVHIKYLEREQEIKLIDLTFPNLDEAIPPIEGKRFAELTVQLAGSLRAAMNDGGLSLPFSVRQIKRFVKASLAFQDVKMAYKYAFWNLLDSVERKAAGDIFQTVFNLVIED